MGTSFARTDRDAHLYALRNSLLSDAHGLCTLTHNDSAPHGQGCIIATDMREVRSVRQTGQVNDRFGVYSNACCGYEVVIREGAIFPYCPNCYSPATWHFAETEVNQPIIIQKKS